MYFFNITCVSNNRTADFVDNCFVNGFRRKSSQYLRLIQKLVFWSVKCSSVKKYALQMKIICRFCHCDVTEH